MRFLTEREQLQQPVISAAPQGSAELFLFLPDESGQIGHDLRFGKQLRKPLLLHSFLFQLGYRGLDKEPFQVFVGVPAVNPLPQPFFLRIPFLTGCALPQKPLQLVLPGRLASQFFSQKLLLFPPDHFPAASRPDRQQQVEIAARFQNPGGGHSGQLPLQGRLRFRETIFFFLTAGGQNKLFLRPGHGDI